MIPPKHRPIAGAVAALIAITPIVVFGAGYGSIQGSKNAAEQHRQSRLEAIAKDFLSGNCYINPKPEIVVGSEVRVKGRSQSVCVTLPDSSRFGFLEYQQGSLVITDGFSKKEVDSKISTLGAK